MKKPEVNFDVALQRRGTAYPLAEALVRGREDCLTDIVSRRIGRCPYKTADLREAWMHGYSTETLEFAQATENVR